MRRIVLSIQNGLLAEALTSLLENSGEFEPYSAVVDKNKRALPACVACSADIVLMEVTQAVHMLGGAALYGVDISAYTAEESLPVDTAEDALSVEYPLYDYADLLTLEEEEEIGSQLITASGTYLTEVAVITVPSADGEDLDVLVQDLYDSMGLGFGETKDGVLLMICMEPRGYRILSNGTAGPAIEADAIEDIDETIVSDLSNGFYGDAMEGYVERVSYYLNGYQNGFPFNFGKSIVTALIIGAAAGLIVALVLKGQLKSVHQRNQANDYIRTGSLQIHSGNDFFLYSEVRQKEKASNSSSGSGSSGSGTSRNVGGGSF